MLRPAPAWVLLLAAASGQTAFAVEDVAWTFSAAGPVHSVEVLPSGNIFIADKAANRGAEIQPSRPLGGGSVLRSIVAGVNSPDSARELPDGSFLIASTGSDQVFHLAADGTTVLWSHGTGAPGCDDSSLFIPGDLVLTSNGEYLIADQGQGRIQRFDASGVKVWQYGSPTCVRGGGPNMAGQPFHLEELPNGDILFADVSVHVVQQIHPTPPSGGDLVWEYGTEGVPGAGTDQLTGPCSAHQLPSGNVLIADAFNNRVIEVAPTLPSGGTIVWQYGVAGTSGSGPGLLGLPYDAARLANGDTLIADHQNGWVVEVSPLRLGLSLPPLTVQRCAPAQLQILDAYGSANAPATVVANLNVSGGDAALFLDPDCASPAPGTLSLVGGTDEGDFYLVASAPGVVEVSANAPSYGQAQASTLAQLSRFDLSVGFACSSAPGGEFPAESFAVWLLLVLVPLRRARTRIEGNR